MSLSNYMPPSVDMVSLVHVDTILILYIPRLNEIPNVMNAMNEQFHFDVIQGSDLIN